MLDDGGQEDGGSPGNEAGLIVLALVHAEGALLVDVALLVLVFQLAQACVDHDAQTGALPDLLHVPWVVAVGAVGRELVVFIAGKQAVELLVGRGHGVAGQAGLEHIGYGRADGGQGGRAGGGQKGEEQVVEEGIEQGQGLVAEEGVGQALGGVLVVRLVVVLAQLGIVVVGDDLRGDRGGDVGRGRAHARGHLEGDGAGQRGPVAAEAGGATGPRRRDVAGIAAAALVRHVRRGRGVVVNWWHDFVFIFIFIFYFILARRVLRTGGARRRRAANSARSGVIGRASTAGRMGG